MKRLVFWLWLNLFLFLSGLCAISLSAPKAHYIPLTCINRFVIHDFGTCKRNGDRLECPNVKLSFSVGCESVKPEQPTPTQMNLVYPSLVRTEEESGQ